MKKQLITSLFCILAASTASARTLTEILQNNIVNDPSVAEALANQRIANSRLNQAKAARWPVLAASAGQKVISSNKDDDSEFNPALQARWTIFDFGKQSATIEKEGFKSDYFAYKTEETTEELINKISRYYLEALKAKMSVVIAKKSYNRHKEVVEQLKIIVDYDPGRRSELTQAKARMLKAKEEISNYNRTLELSLLQLGRYIQPTIKKEELQDPFKKLSIEKIVKKYKVSTESLQNHPSYIAQQREMSSIEAEQKDVERSRWPSVDLMAQVSKKESAVYLNFNVDVLNFASTPKINEKKYQVNAAKARLNSIVRNLRERSNLAELRMREDKAKINITKRQIKELAQVAKDYEDQFFIAKRSLLDVVNAYRELSSMELLEVQAKYDLMTAKLDYLSSIGGLRLWAGLDTNQAFKKGGLVIAQKASQKEIEKVAEKEVAVIKDKVFLTKNNTENNENESVADNAITISKPKTLNTETVKVVNLDSGDTENNSKNVLEKEIARLEIVQDTSDNNEKIADEKTSKEVELAEVEISTTKVPIAADKEIQKHQEIELASAETTEIEVEQQPIAEVVPVKTTTAVSIAVEPNAIDKKATNSIPQNDIAYKDNVDNKLVENVAVSNDKIKEEITIPETVVQVPEQKKKPTGVIIKFAKKHNNNKKLKNKKPASLSVNKSTGVIIRFSKKNK